MLCFRKRIILHANKLNPGLKEFDSAGLVPHGLSTLYL